MATCFSKYVALRVYFCIFKVWISTKAAENYHVTYTSWKKMCYQFTMILNFKKVFLRSYIIPVSIVYSKIPVFRALFSLFFGFEIRRLLIPYVGLFLKMYSIWLFGGIFGNRNCEVYQKKYFILWSSDYFPLFKKGGRACE